MTSDKDTSERDELAEIYLNMPYTFIGDEVVKITRAFYAGWSARDAEVERIKSVMIYFDDGSEITVGEYVALKDNEG